MINSKIILNCIVLLTMILFFSCSKTTAPQVVDKDEKSENASGGKGGLSPGIHDVKIDGQSAIVIVPKNYDPTKPTYLAFRLHGDGAKVEKNTNSYKISVDSPEGAINKFIEKKNWILVSPSPKDERYSWWGGPMSRLSNPTKHINTAKVRADHFFNVLKHMFKKYNLYTDKIYGFGASGGAEFYASQYLPIHGDKYNIEMLLISGGDHPWLEGGKELAKKNFADMAKKTHFWLIYGEKESSIMLKGIKRVKSFFGFMGVKIDEKVIAGGKHHNYWPDQGLPSTAEVVVKYWDKVSKD